jgi:PKD repeat protein
VGFNATASSDAAGTIGAYSWSFGDGAGASGAAPSHTFDAPGSYLVTLTVTNNHGQTATAVNVVTVDAPPTAAFTIAPNPVMVGVSVTFDASSSTRPPNLSAGYVWTFGDGGTAGGPVVNHAYAKPGSYGVTLLVFDSDGQSTTAVEHVTVTAPRLQGQLTILGGQGVGSIRRHGLMVSLSSTQSGKATFSITARINKTEPSGKPKRVTLLRGRTLTVASGRRRLTLNLSAVASRAMVRGHVAGLVVQVTVLDIFGQRLTLSASLRL